MSANIERRWLVGWLRLHGLTFSAIGERLGITRSHAQQLYLSYRQDFAAMPLPEQADMIGFRDFADGTCRPIFEDARGQFIVDVDGERIDGIFLLADEPVIVERPESLDP
jgi:hypothetical protein